MGVFYVFEIVQMVPNRAKRYILILGYFINTLQPGDAFLYPLKTSENI